MNPNQDQEVTREPIDHAAVAAAIEEEFTFNNAPNESQVRACQHLEAYGRGFAQEIATLVPEGKEQAVAINAVLNALVWARQGITRRTVDLIAVNPA